MRLAKPKITVLVVEGRSLNSTDKVPSIKKSPAMETGTNPSE